MYIENSSASLIVIDKTSIELLTSKQGYNALQSEYEILNAMLSVLYIGQASITIKALSYLIFSLETILLTQQLYQQQSFFDSLFQFSSLFFHL